MDPCQDNSVFTDDEIELLQDQQDKLIDENMNEVFGPDGLPGGTSTGEIPEEEYEECPNQG